MIKYIQKIKHKGVKKMKDIIGKFNGRKVYKTNTTDYINKRLYNNEEDIFIINREMIYKNEVFATYDGTYVEELDYNQRYEFYRIPEPATIEAKVMVDGKGVRYVEYETNLPDPVGNLKNETKIPETVPASDFEFKTVDEILDSSFGSFATEMTDIDAFLKSNS